MSTRIPCADFPRVTTFSYEDVISRGGDTGPGATPWHRMHAAKTKALMDKGMMVAGTLMAMTGKPMRGAIVSDDGRVTWLRTEQVQLYTGMAVPKGLVCKWREDADGAWWRSCGGAWVFGGCTDSNHPADHHMHFCPHCGQPIEAIEYQEKA